MRKIIFTLAAAVFAVGTEAQVFTGLLGDLCKDLGISLTSGGQLVSSFALVFALTAPITNSLLAGKDRRRLLTVALIALCVLNAACALAENFTVLLLLRIACGLFAPLVIPTASGTAARLAPPQERGKALATVLLGLTLSFVLGIPLGTFCGGMFGWRATFAFASILAGIATVLVRINLPELPSSEKGGLISMSAVLDASIFRYLLLTCLLFASVLAVGAYMGPIITLATGLTGSLVGVIQLFYGFGSAIGSKIGGHWSDKGKTQDGLLLMFTSLIFVAYGISALVILVPQGNILSYILISALILLVSVCLFCALPMIQYQLISAAPDKRSVLLSFNSSFTFLGQAIGAIAGGFTIEWGTIRYLGITSAALALLGMIVTAVIVTRVQPVPEST